jgi:hypothetical protein
MDIEFIVQHKGKLRKMNLIAAAQHQPSLNI